MHSRFFFLLPLLSVLAPFARAQTAAAPLTATSTTTAAAKPAVDDVQKLDAYRVEARYSGLDPKPATTSSVVSAEEMQSFNVISVEDALKYVPNLAFRRRFIGDVFSGIAIRGSNHAMTARTVVEADGLLLSNFLNNGLASSPRFSLVAPEEIARTELIYGPFSALHGGNSLAGVMKFTTHTPERFQASARATWFFHEFREYGTDETFRGSNYALTLGDRKGRFSYFIFYNRLRNESHPIDFLFLNLSATTAPTTTPATVVTGGYRDQDLNGTNRIVYGEAGPIGTRHDLFKAKLSYELTPQIRLRANVILWTNDEDRHDPQSYVFDASGQPVNSGRVQLDGRVFTIPPAALSLFRRDRENLLTSLGIEQRLPGDWEFSALGSVFEIRRDVLRARTGTGRVRPPDR